ncbi:thioredoxin [Marinimicrobium koreense]|uniref:Thioredoxin n=1 Tax=Marinimicrobium koreense TaxID=306545 RepID=A0A3N1P9P8_9GAMM|nr:thioredoxin family protein [Marinimicrobium koreense]ROQ21426.1 thioredoxin [Marinimicrobium koreense]
MSILKYMLAMISFTFALNAVSAEVEKVPFTEERFKALQTQSDTLILLDVHAEWCPTCAKQGEALAEYQTENPEVPLTILNIDFDDQKEWVKHFKAPRQSTLILYKGEDRLWFSVAETRKEVIFDALNEAAGQVQ